MKRNLLNLFLALAFLIGFIQCNTKNSSANQPEFKPTIELKNVWSSDTILQKPESVIYNPADGYLYVSNINGEDAGLDSNGFISRLTIDGKIETLHWSKGLDAPKGMGIYQNQLFVADVNKVAIISLTTGEIDTIISIPNSIFLNDIAISEEGEIYISDSHTSKIHLLKEKKITTWFDQSTFQLPNGLFVQGDDLIVADMDAGKLFSINRTTKELKELAKDLPKCDGINALRKDYLISCWPGEVYVTNKSSSIRLLDTKEEGLNAADAWFIEEKQLLIIPTFFGNNVVGYSVTEKD